MPDHITFEYCDALRFVFACIHRVCVCVCVHFSPHLMSCCCRCCRCYYLPLFNKRHQKKNILHSPLFLCVLSFIFYSNQVSHLFSMLPFSLCRLFYCRRLRLRLPSPLTSLYLIPLFDALHNAPSSWFSHSFHPLTNRSLLPVLCLYLRLYCKRRVHKACASFYRQKTIIYLSCSQKRSGQTFSHAQNTTLGPHLRIGMANGFKWLYIGTLACIRKRKRNGTHTRTHANRDTTYVYVRVNYIV